MVMVYNDTIYNIIQFSGIRIVNDDVSDVVIRKLVSENLGLYTIMSIEEF